MRAIARLWDLPVWDKPASPCLASRLAYGVEVTPERLAMVDAAERFLRGLRDEGVELPEVRVRCHEGEVARIEAPLSAVAALAEEPVRERVVNELRRLGFRRVTLDLAGFESGSLNTLVTLESLQRAR